MADKSEAVLRRTRKPEVDDSTPKVRPEMANEDSTRYIPPPRKNNKDILDILKLRFSDNPSFTLFADQQG